MPELPEVEVVRRGLVSWVRGRTITGVDVLDPRSIRRHALGPEDFAGNLEGATVLDVVRRGKFLWMPLQEAGAVPGEDPLNPPKVALMAHLGMSGQLLMQDSAVPDEKHLKVRLRLSPRDGMPGQLRFVDQRIFGGLFVTSLVPTDDGGPGGLAEKPLPADRRGGGAHRARPPGPVLLLRRLLPPAPEPQDRPEDGRSWTRAWCPESATSMRTRPCGGPNSTTPAPPIPCGGLTLSACSTAAREVMLDALEAGGTSFDSLYVNVNGASGYFDRSLNAYGSEGEQCRRCAASGICP